jgi:hypothetical protein
MRPLLIVVALGAGCTMADESTSEPPYGLFQIHRTAHAPTLVWPADYQIALHNGLVEPIGTGVQRGAVVYDDPNELELDIDETWTSTSGVELGPIVVHYEFEVIYVDQLEGSADALVRDGNTTIGVTFEVTADRIDPLPASAPI